MFEPRVQQQLCQGRSARNCTCAGAASERLRQRPSRANHPHLHVLNGVIASGSLSGSLSFTVAVGSLDEAQAASAGPSFAMADVSVTGSLKIVGSPAIALSGTYSTTTHTLTLTGGDYTFSGTYADGQVEGTFTSPTESGTFSVQPSTGATVRNYCGTYTGTADHGHFNIAVNLTASTASGAWASEMDGSSGPCREPPQAITSRSTWRAAAPS